MRISRSAAYGYGDTINRPKDNPYWASFTDLMASIMLIFLLTTVYFALLSHAIIESPEHKDTLIDFLEKSIQSVQMDTKLNLHDDAQRRSTDDLNSAEDMQLSSLEPTLEDFKDQTLNGLQNELKDAGVEASVNQHDFVLHIPTDQLNFKQGEYKFNKKSKKVLNTVARQLHQMLLVDGHISQFKSIAIEGHTDSVPARKLPMGNWGLSTYRAISFWQELRNNKDYGHVLSSLTNIHGQHLFSVAGYADTRRRIQKDDTPAKQRVNRRIDIRFTMLDIPKDHQPPAEQELKTSNFSSMFDKGRYMKK